MKAEDYQKITEETAIYPNKVDNFGLAYTFLGLVGEDLEVQDKYENPSKEGSLGLIKELGDSLWYVRALCKEVGLDFVELVNAKSPYFYKEYNILQLAEPIKKFYRDKAPLDLKLFKSVLLSTLEGIRSAATMEGYSLEQVMEINYNKLMARRATNTINGSGDNREILTK